MGLGAIKVSSRARKGQPRPGASVTTGDTGADPDPAAAFSIPPGPWFLLGFPPNPLALLRQGYG